MKTRGKGKGDIPDMTDPRDFLEEGENTNGFNDERADDVILFIVFQKSKISRALLAEATAGLTQINASNNP